jgi:hypothetical protein
MIKLKKVMKPDLSKPVTTPSTCPLKWGTVDNDQEKWFCEHCQHHVHNLSSMTHSEAKRFMKPSSSERLCISFLQDEQGRAIFKQPSLPFIRGAKKLSGLVSTFLVMVLSSCTTTSQKGPDKEHCGIINNNPSGEKYTADGNGAPSTPPRRWTGF